MTTDYSMFGLRSGEVPAANVWIGVEDVQRSGVATLGRGVARVMLPTGLRRLIVPDERTVAFTLTQDELLVVAWLTERPLRFGPGQYHVTDRGHRRTMRTVVRGRLAAITLGTDVGEFDLLIPEDALPALTAHAA